MNKVSVITAVWMQDLCHHCLFPTAGFCHLPSLIFVAFRRCKSFPAQNLLSNFSVKCLAYKRVPAILINNTLYLFLHKLMDEKLHKSAKKIISPKKRVCKVTAQRKPQTFPSNSNPAQHCLARSVSCFPPLIFFLILLYLLVDSLMKLKEIIILTLWF